MNGQVSIQPGGVDDWVAATVNRPLTTGDNVWTDKESRAELHLGTAALRMDGETSVTLSSVNDNTVQLDLHQGTLNLRIVQLYDGEVYEVDTPNLAFTVLKSGDYRFDVDPNGDTTLVTVRKGEGEATGDGPGVRVNGGKQAQFSGGKSLERSFSSAPGRDGFDDWCRVRDEREDRSEAIRYVPRGVIGYEDLDEYGRWEEVHPYGHVWVPASVVVGWAPYRYGHWVWVAPWGWTWVDDAPWGFAPFHYGRWVHYHRGWAWCPGPVVVRPYYAPALVAWVGGANWGVGLSFGAGGGVGWFPLGYGEPYVPRYEHSRGYFQNVNVTNTHITNITYVTNTYYNNTTNITRIKYVNERVDGAVSAVPRHTFENSRPVDRDIVRIDRRHLRDASVVREPDARPSRNSELGVHGGNHGARPPAHVFERPVVSRMPRPAGPDRREDRREDRRDDRRAGGPPEGRPADRADRGQGSTRDRDRSADKNRGQDGDNRDRSADKDRGQGADKERDRNADKDHGNGNNMERPTGGSRWGHSVPRPPEAGGPPRDAENRKDPAHSTPNAADLPRGNRPLERPEPRGESKAASPESVPHPNDRNADRDRGRSADKDHGNGNDMERPSGSPRWGRPVPRPPESGGPARDAENRNNPAHSTPNNANVPHGKGPVERPAPLPRERNVGGKASEAQNPSPQPDRGPFGPRPQRDNASSEQVIARPHDQNTRWTRGDVRTNSASGPSNPSNAAETPRPSRDQGPRNMPRPADEQRAARPAPQRQDHQPAVPRESSYRDTGRDARNAQPSHVDNSRSQPRAPEMQGRQSVAPRDSGPHGNYSSDSGRQASHSGEQHKSEASNNPGKSKENH
jgi:hypothetical protein